MKHNVVVATHHKTGTVWMAAVFKAIAREIGARYVDFWANYDRLDRRLEPRFILFNHDSMFLQHAQLLARDDVRILHVIRDPRDVVISATHYHKTSSESWLGRTLLDGIGYQRKLVSLGSALQQYLYEMDNATSSTIDTMASWEYGRSNCLDVRYEDLRHDDSLAQWSRIAAFLGFEEAELELCRKCFWKHSLFGGANGRRSRHVRSGDVAQWKSEFTPELGRAFLDRFPDALQILGYEPDDSWIDRLSAEPAIS